jgi:hypothetical protein
VETAQFVTYLMALAVTFVGLILIVVLVGCSAPEHGTVYDKQYFPAWSYTSYDCVSYNKNGTCSLRIPSQHYFPASWQLCLREGDKAGCRDVDERSWHDYQIGQRYP